MDFEYKSFSRLGDETLLPFVDKTITQELLATKISFEQRVAHLIPFAEPNFETLELAEIDARIGAPSRWSSHWLSSLGLRSSDIMANPEQVPYLLPLLEEEWAWNLAYEALNPMVAENQVAEFLARNNNWVAETLADLYIYAQPGISPRNGKPSYLYEKEVIKKLRHIIHSVPPAHHQVTIDDIATILGISKKSTQTALTSLGYGNDLRPSQKVGRLARHFPFEAIEQVAAKRAEIAPAGEWLSIGRMALLLGKDDEWVSVRVRGIYDHLAEERLSDQGHPITVYPPSVFEVLQKQALFEAALPVATEADLSKRALARVVKHGVRWVDRRLPLIETQPRLMRDKLNRVEFHYNEHAAIELLDLE